MRIMQIIPDLRLAGAETMCANLCVALADLKHDVCVVSLYNTQTAITRRLEASGIRVIYLNKRLGFDVSLFFKLFALFNKEKPEVVHTHIIASKYALPVSLLYGIKKRVHTIHSVAQREQSKLGRSINQLMFRLGGTTPVALSDEIQKTVCDVYGLDANKVPCVFNGVNLERCIAKKDYSTSNRFTVVHVGRFMEVKNHELIVRAFSMFHQLHPDVCLKFIGDGELRPYILEQVTSLRLENSVEFLGMQSNVYPFLNEADVFILPSKYEGIPLSLIEAMGTGLPIIASAVGGIPDMVKDKESALLIQPKEEELVNALECLYRDKALREQLGVAAKARAHLFSSERMAAQYASIYQSG